MVILGFEINPKHGGKFSEVLTAEEWRKFTHAMSTGLDSGLRINDNSILVECEVDSKYQYKLVIYDNTFDDNPLEKVYAIGNIDYNKTDGNKIANFIIKLEENNYDSTKVFRQLLRDYTKQFELILGQYNIKSKRFNDIGRNSVKNGRVNEGQSNRAGVNQEIGQELSAGVKEKFLLDEDTNINIDDIKILRSINQKSVNAFNSDDIKKSEKWARKFYKEIGIKSPFFRAWFGDWGAYDSTKIWTKTTANGL